MRELGGGGGALRRIGREERVGVFLRFTETIPIFIKKQFPFTVKFQNGHPVNADSCS